MSFSGTQTFVPENSLNGDRHRNLVCVMLKVLPKEVTLSPGTAEKAPSIMTLKLFLAASVCSRLASPFYTQLRTTQLWGRVGHDQLIKKLFSAVGLISTTDLWGNKLSPPALAQLVHDYILLCPRRGYRRKSLSSEWCSQSNCPVELYT